MKLYEDYAEEIARLIHDRVLRPGERIPSVRRSARKRGLSPGTVLQAYSLLENRGLIEARPRSGYYVSPRWDRLPPEPEMTRPSTRSARVDISELVFSVLESTKNRKVIPLGSAFPSPLLFPMRQLSTALAAATRRLDPWRTVEDLPPGSRDLLRLVARHYAEEGMSLPPEQLVITSGAMEALNLCLQAVTRPGDIVAVEAPAFYASLQAIEAYGLRAVEIPTDPREGVSIPALARALSRHPVKACWFMSNFQNPLGSLMTDGSKEELVRLLARHGVPLIEDDVYNELYLGSAKPKPAKAYDRAGLVMHCSSFSKCLAPGYRVGWVAAGRFAEAVHRRKLMSTLSASIPAQLGIAEYLKHGGFERHLRRLRQALASQQSLMLQAIARRFPAGTRLTRPKGGYFVWVELPGGADALEVHRLAMERGISVAPGPMFSAKRAYRNCLRINYGHPFTDEMESGVAEVGAIAKSLCRG